MERAEQLLRGRCECVPAAEDCLDLLGLLCCLSSLQFVVAVYEESPGGAIGLKAITCEGPINTRERVTEAGSPCEQRPKLPHGVHTFKGAPQTGSVCTLQSIGHKYREAPDSQQSSCYCSFQELGLHVRVISCMCANVPRVQGTWGFPGR